ncbi:MAG: hypothetical protein JNM70_20630 [Anaerolineae bacterium]|nr:hypothetical protein [Anaerolineae bacterium]
MNSVIEQKWSWVEGSNQLRDELMNSLSDADLAFTPGGQNISLGALCREMGEVQHSYNESFRTFSQSFDYRNTEPGLDGSVARLRAWYQALDADMKTLLSAMSEEDTHKMIDRGGGFALPVSLQVDVYLQALLIFFGKVSVFLKAMNRPLPKQMAEWIW